MVIFVKSTLRSSHTLFGHNTRPSTGKPTGARSCCLSLQMATARLHGRENTARHLRHDVRRSRQDECSGASTCRGQLSSSVCVSGAVAYISTGRLPGLEAPSATGSEPIHSNDARALAAAGAAAFRPSGSARLA